eukprot:gene24058-biopygen11877
MYENDAMAGAVLTHKKRARGSEKVMKSACRRNWTGPNRTRPNRTQMDRQLKEGTKDRKGKRRRALQGNGMKGVNSHKIERAVARR